uniref:Uncharacterized protein n=1 Tax=Crocodylus porosus TaxID=8502 RepID=A0A7M4FXW8_CROPO
PRRAAGMEPPAGPFFRARHGAQRYVCYCGAEPGPCVTSVSCLCREAFEHRTAALTVHNGRATLELKEDAWSLTFDLFKLPSSEARIRLQALMFGLVGYVSSLEKRLEGTGHVCMCKPVLGAGEGGSAVLSRAAKSELPFNSEHDLLSGPERGSLIAAP